MSGFYEWVKGPEFAEWLEEVRPDWRQEVTESQTRAVGRFRVPGTLGELNTVDGICCALFLHIDEIPDHIWSEVGPQKGRRIDGEKKMQAIEMVEAGVPISQAAKAAGVHYETLRYWFQGRREAA